MRFCKECGVEKELEKFVNQNGKYRYKCKECKNAKRRTGKPRSSFPKGHIPWNTGTKKIKEKKVRSLYNTDRKSKLYKAWRQKVFKRDGFKCTKCESTEKLHPHHIVPYNQSLDKRLDIDNGITFCCSCHIKHEIRLRKVSDETRKKMSESHKGFKWTEESKEKLSKTVSDGRRKGKIPWNKGTKGVCKAWNKGLKRNKV